MKVSSRGVQIREGSPNLLAKVDPRGPYPLADLDRGSNSGGGGGQNPLGHRLQGAELHGDENANKRKLVIFLVFQNIHEIWAESFSWVEIICFVLSNYVMFSHYTSGLSNWLGVSMSSMQKKQLLRQ